MFKKKSGIIIYLFFSVTILHQMAHASADLSIDISKINNSFSLGGKALLLREKDMTLNPEDIISDSEKYRFYQSHEITPNFGFTKDSIWIKFIFINSSRISIKKYLCVDFPLLRTVEFYTFRNKDGKKIPVSHEKTGRSKAFRDRTVINRNFIFPIDTGPGEELTVLIKVNSDDAVIIPVKMLSHSTLTTELQDENMAFGIYYGILIVMILYNMFIFISTRDKNYLFYVLFISSFGLFQISMNGLAYKYLWPHTPEWTRHSNPFFIGIASFWGAQFTINFLNLKSLVPALFRTLYFLSIAAVIFTISSLFMDYHNSIAIGQILPLAMIIVVIPAAIISLLKGNISARYYLAGWTILFIGIIASALRVMNIAPHNFFTEYGLQMGSAIEMVFLSLALADRIKLMEGEKTSAQDLLIKTQQEMMKEINNSKFETEKANSLLKISENKYRRLVEGSSDLIFTLDHQWNFKTVNSSFSKKLKIRDNDLNSLNFFDILYTGDHSGNINQNLTSHKLNKFSESNEPVEFVTQLISHMNTEPKEMKIRLEHIEGDSGKEILGKASTVLDDSLLRYLTSEKQEFYIGNYLITVEEITQRITRNLKKYFRDSTVKLIQIALREIILNSIEHGNLGITFEEKSQSQTENRYFELLRERQQTTEHLKKRVRIAYSLDENELVYTIEDEGEGFNHKDLMNKFSDIANDNFLTHGRGITMAMSIFDETEYNEKGNIVTLIKYTNESEEENT